MLKARNLFIIFILNYLLLLFVSSVIELILLSNKAEQIELMIRTAADMALDQVQATDDFFMSGGGYFVNDNGEIRNEASFYTSKIVGLDGKYQDVPIYQLVTQKNTVKDIYNELYKEADIIEFIDNNPDVLKMQVVGSAGKYVGDNYAMAWYGVPTICEMGHPNVWNKVKDNSFNANKVGVTYLNSANFGGSGLSNYNYIDNDILNRLEQMFELTTVDKKHVLGSNSASIDYYLSPLSLGITYINTELLQTFFMNNMELLMRGKYTLNGEYNLNNADGEYGNGVYKGSFYADMVNDESIISENPINNGMFTLLRGPAKSVTIDNLGSYTYYIGMKPKIRYKVIDMYDESGDHDDLMRQVFGYFIHKNNSSTGYDFVSGSELKKRDMETIKAYNEIVFGSPTPINDEYKFFEHKYFVIAEVTFYADIIVPYDTPSIREMRGRIDDGGVISGRTLFDAFSYVQTSSVPVPKYNYVNLQNFRDEEGNPRNNIPNDESNKVYLDNVYNLNGDMGRSAYAYTTFFAVTP